MNISLAVTSFALLGSSLHYASNAAITAGIVAQSGTPHSSLLTIDRQIEEADFPEFDHDPFNAYDDKGNKYKKIDIIRKHKNELPHQETSASAHEALLYYLTPEVRISSSPIKSKGANPGEDASWGVRMGIETEW